MPGTARFDDQIDKFVKIDKIVNTINGMAYGMKKIRKLN